MKYLGSILYFQIILFISFAASAETTQSEVSRLLKQAESQYWYGCSAAEGGTQVLQQFADYLERDLDKNCTQFRSIGNCLGGGVGQSCSGGAPTPCDKEAIDDLTRRAKGEATEGRIVNDKGEFKQIGGQGKDLIKEARDKLKKEQQEKIKAAGCDKPEKDDKADDKKADKKDDKKDDKKPDDKVADKPDDKKKPADDKKESTLYTVAEIPNKSQKCQDLKKDLEKQAKDLEEKAKKKERRPDEFKEDSDRVKAEFDSLKLRREADPKLKGKTDEQLLAGIYEKRARAAQQLRDDIQRLKTNNAGAGLIGLTRYKDKLREFANQPGNEKIKDCAEKLTKAAANELGSEILSAFGPAGHAANLLFNNPISECQAGAYSSQECAEFTGTANTLKNAAGLIPGGKVAGVVGTGVIKASTPIVAGIARKLGREGAEKLAQTGTHVPELLKKAKKFDHPDEIPGGAGGVESAAFKGKFLKTADIQPDDLPYKSAIRPVEAQPAKKIDRLPAGSVQQTDTVLASTEHSGSAGLVRLADFEGRPVVTKAYALADGDPLRANKEILKEASGAKLASDLGIGPKFHGVYKDSQGRWNTVTDVVPGDFNTPITKQSFADLRTIEDRLQGAGVRGAPDFQPYRTQDGRLLVIDPRLETRSHEKLMHLDGSVELVPRRNTLRRDINGEYARMITTAHPQVAVEELSRLRTTDPRRHSELLDMIDPRSGELADYIRKYGD